MNKLNYYFEWIFTNLKYPLEKMENLLKGLLLNLSKVPVPSLSKEVGMRISKIIINSNMNYGTN